MNDVLKQLQELNQGFRSAYLNWTQLESQLDAWAAAFPNLVNLETIGESGEGRRLRLLTIGPDPERIRPAVWVDGNMHASEVAGTNACLAIAEDILRLHLDRRATLHSLPVHVCDRLRRVLFHVLPRMSPDGAEAVLDTGRWVRSVPRDQRAEKQSPRWIAEDMNDDGLALSMRWQDLTGTHVEHPDLTGVMRPRHLEDPGPYYVVYPEGTIANYDGENLPAPAMLSDNSPDLNRNFPWGWAPEKQQLGAGVFPGSEPESRAVLEATTARPNLFAWLDFHCFGGVFIRPLGEKPDNKMNPVDLAVFQQIEAWNEEHTGYPTVSGFEQFTYEPEQPIHGDLVDYGYNQRGAICYVCELWDIFEKLGVRDKKRRFVENYTKLTREEAEKVVSFDKEQNDSRIFRGWQKIQHPQLGEVEVGGTLPLIGIWNPPHDQLAEVCRGQSAAFLRVAAMLPEVHLTLSLKEIGEGLRQVDVTVENHGYLPTHGLDSAKSLSFNEPLYANLDLGGPELVSPSLRQEVGHLDGWGGGRFTGLHTSHSGGSGSRRKLRWLIRGPGPVSVEVGSCRVGFQTVSG